MDLVADLNVDLERVLLYKNPDGTPVDLTGYTAKAEARESAGSALVLNLSPTISAPLKGEITLHASHDVMTAKALGLDNVRSTGTLQESLADGTSLTGYGKVVNWDLILIDPYDLETKLVSGRIVFVSTITE